MLGGPARTFEHAPLTKMCMPPSGQLSMARALDELAFATLPACALFFIFLPVIAAINSCQAWEWR